MELTAQDICKIIKSCRDNAVKIFEYGNVKISFRIDAKAQFIAGHTPSDLTPTGKPISEEVDKSHVAEEEYLLSETVLTREAQLASLVTLEPEKYEDLIASGDLVDAKPDDQ